MTDLATLKKKGAADWQALNQSEEPVIYLGMASCGKAAGADRVKKVKL